MAAPNFVSDSIWTGDNLAVMRGINSECVDLVYLDPPFNSNRTYEAPIGSKAAGASFKDAWTLDDIDVHEHGELAERNPAAYSVIEAARQAHGKGMQSYLIFMAVRLLEIRRILKPEGSVYLHCDPTASHYLKLLMDGIFGRAQFKNEVIWSYRRWLSGWSMTASPKIAARFGAERTRLRSRRSEPTWGSCPTTGRTAIASTASRRAYAPGAIRTFRSASWTSTISYRVRAAGKTIPIICNCYVPAATVRRAGARWPNGVPLNDSMLG